MDISLAELVRNGKEVLEEPEEPRAPEQMVELVEAYAQAFSRWFPENQELFDPSREPDPDLQQLLQVHERVLELAQALMENTSDERVQLSKRGKGILSYLDILPKRISVTGTRKG